MSAQIPARLGVQQRVLPSYRVPFFDALAAACERGCSIFYGQPRPGDQIEMSVHPQIAACTQGFNRHLFGGPFTLCAQNGLLEWLESWQPDALIVEANPRNLNTPAAARWMRRKGRPVIGWGLGLGSTALPAFLRREYLKNFDVLLTYSHSGAESFLSAGFPAERIFVAPNAVTARPQNPPPARPDDFRGGRPSVLFVGRLQERKRVDLLLRACAAMPEDRKPGLVIIGDGPARAGLEALAGEVYPAAQFAGAKHGAELEPYFAAADLFALPGTGGLALQEAMAHALPVMAAEADGTQADLIRPENGWQLAPGDLDALSYTLTEALGSAARLRRMGLESYRIVAEEINIEAMVDAFAHAVRLALGRAD